MKTMKNTILCLGLLSAPLAPAADEAGEKNPKPIIVGQFTNALNQCKLEPGVRQQLLKAAKYQRLHGEATIHDSNQTITVQVHRVSDRLTKANQRVIIRLFVSRGLVRQIAANSKAVQDALKPFQYPQLVLNQVGGNLVTSVSAKTLGLGQHTQIQYGKGYVAAVCVLPTQSVDLNAVKLIRAKTLLAIYLRQVGQLEQMAMGQRKYQLALDYLAELDKHGFSSQRANLDTHVCHLHLGDKPAMEASALNILALHSAGLNEKECLELHQHATRTKQGLLAALWSAEARYRKPVVAAPNNKRPTSPVAKTKGTDSSEK